MTTNILDAYNYVVVFGEFNDGRTIRYNDNNTVQVVRVSEPMRYTEAGAKKVLDIYTSMKCNCVQMVKLVDYEILLNL